MVTMTDNKPQPLKVTIEEQFLYPKSGRPETCEDSIYLGDNFIAVIDGATSKTEAKWDDDTPGRIAAKLATRSLDNTPPTSTAREAVEIMTETVQEFYRNRNILDQLGINPALKATASFAALSLARSEVWVVGDCQILLNDKLIRGNKVIDHLLSEIRAIYLETELMLGKTVEELELVDTGREFILPILRRQQFYQNSPSHEYWYPAIDGFHVPDEGIVVESITEEIRSIILATDGYIGLYGTLAESEAALKRILEEDPLLFRKYKSTKGKLTGQDSFDDRAYIRMSVR